ncbi:MAG TPA: hypothetical protein PLY36_14865 [Spirochaetota bacterium]|nr:hypothetical protein [Spirochaetota bacterium]
MHKRERFKTFIIIFILTGLYIFVFSESGILERRALNKKYNQLAERIDNIKTSNSMLSKECENYRSGIYSNSDIIGSGFVYKTGKLMYINDTGKETVPIDGTTPDDFLISLDHLRIIWILISVMFLFYYFLKKNKSDDATNGPDFN